MRTKLFFLGVIATAALGGYWYLARSNYGEGTSDETLPPVYQALMFAPASTDAAFAALSPSARPVHGGLQYPVRTSAVGSPTGVREGFFPTERATCLGFPEEAGGYDVVRCRYMVGNRRVEYFRSGDLAGLRIVHGLVVDDAEQAVRRMVDTVLEPAERIIPIVTGQKGGLWFGTAEPLWDHDEPHEIGQSTFRWWLSDHDFAFVAYPAMTDKSQPPRGPTKGELLPFQDQSSLAYHIPEAVPWQRLADSAIDGGGPWIDQSSTGVEWIPFQWRGVAPAYRVAESDRCTFRYADDQHPRDVIACASYDNSRVTLTDGRRALFAFRTTGTAPEVAAKEVLELDYSLTKTGDDGQREFGHIGTEQSPMVYWHEAGTLYLLGRVAFPDGEVKEQARWLPRLRELEKQSP